MPDWLTAAARRRPDHPAVVAPDGAATYAQLDERADVAAARLAALGVGEGGRVATTLRPSLAFCELLHGAPRLGAALVPLNTRLPEPERRAQSAAVAADAVVTAPLDGIEAAVRLDRDPSPGAVHTVLFTSGTEGAPKAVELTVANHDASAAASATAFGVRDDDRWLCPLPLFHVAGIGVLVRCARNATTAVLHDRFDAATVAAALAGGEATLVSLVPAQLRRLREAGLTAAPGLRALLLGGGPIPPDLIDWAQSAGLPVRCTYGMTETASQVAVTDPGETAATVLPGAEIAIAADGEIRVRGAMVAPGAAGPDGWLATGDTGSLDRGGRLRVAGRIKELIVTGGEKVAPAAVEAVLCSHPAIADAGVGATADPDWGEAVTAYVLERRPVSDYELLAYCRERLAGYQAPKLVVRVAELPRNAGGKLLRGRLADAPRAAG